MLTAFEKEDPKVESCPEVERINFQLLWKGLDLGFKATFKFWTSFLHLFDVLTGLKTYVKIPILDAFKLLQDLSNSYESAVKVCFVAVLFTVNSELTHPNTNYSVHAFEVISDEILRKGVGLKCRIFRMKHINVLLASQTCI